MVQDATVRLAFVDADYTHRLESGLVLPAQTGLHAASMALPLIAVIWTIGAVVGAHAFHIRRCTCQQ